MVIYSQPYSGHGRNLRHDIAQINLLQSLFAVHLGIIGQSAQFRFELLLSFIEILS